MIYLVIQVQACTYVDILPPYGISGQVRLAAAVCLHIAVAYELVAGQTMATLQPDKDCGARCPGGTALRNGPSGQSVVPPRLLGE
jgi:hypothetical protein